MIINTKEEENIKKMKEGFFAIISHELRTPLNAIKGISDLLVLNKVKRKDYDEMFRTINYSSNYMLTLVNDILDFSKINENKFILQEIEFNLEKTIESCFRINENNARNKGLEYKIFRHDTLPEIVRGDEQRLTQVIINVISNAIKYTPKGSVVVEYGGNYSIGNSKFILDIKVTDTGVGIQNKELASIFQKYRQLNNNETTGIGLGLYITQNIVKLKKGKIDVESEQNKGTVFTISIPYQIIKDGRMLNNEFNYDHLSNISVLVVDDNQINLRVIRKMLLSFLKECNVDTASNGSIALKMMTQKKYDVVLMDLLMPVMNGIETTKKIRSNGDKLPIIAVTANSFGDCREECLSCGMNDIIVKPFDINDLLNTMQRYVNSENS